MNDDKNYMPCWVLFFTVSGLLWLLLIILKAAGVFGISWISVLLGAFWLPVLVLAFFLGIAALLVLAAAIKRKLRGRRLIRLAKELNAWDPKVAGGKTLNLHAELLGVKRRPGETDAQLRRRCIAKTRNGGGHNDL